MENITLQEVLKEISTRLTEGEESKKRIVILQERLDRAMERERNLKEEIDTLKHQVHTLQGTVQDLSLTIQRMENHPEVRMQKLQDLSHKRDEIQQQIDTLWRSYISSRSQYGEFPKEDAPLSPPQAPISDTLIASASNDLQTSEVPTGSTDSTDPTDPTDPTDSTDPADSVDPADTQDPADTPTPDPTDSVDPADIPSPDFADTPTSEDSSITDQDITQAREEIEDQTHSQDE